MGKKRYTSSDSAKASAVEAEKARPDTKAFSIENSDGWHRDSTRMRRDAINRPQERDENDDGELEVRPAGDRAEKWQQEREIQQNAKRGHRWMLRISDRPVGKE